MDPHRLRTYPVVLTSYITARRLHLDLARLGWSVVVLDEAQKIKNPAAMTTQILKGLKARLRIAVTGTPVENGLADRWSIMDFALPGRLGCLKDFLDRHPIEAETDHEELSRRIYGEAAPFFLRRRKQDHLEGLPPRQSHPVELPMTPLQREQYLEAIASYRRRPGPGGILELLIRLGQLSCCAEGIDPENLGELPTEELTRYSCKLKWLLEKLREIRERGEKPLVFLEYRKLQRLLAAVLEREFAIPVGMINGDVPAGALRGKPSPRRRMIDDFRNRKGFGVLVISPLAGGVGLNLVEANQVIHFSRHWNPAREDQATDRAYRIGQKRTVHVYFPLATLEEFPSFDVRLHALLEQKRLLAEKALFPVTSSEIDVERELGDLLEAGEPESRERVPADVGTPEAATPAGDGPDHVGKGEGVCPSTADGLPGWMAHLRAVEAKKLPLKDAVEWLSERLAPYGEPARRLSRIARLPSLEAHALAGASSRPPDRLYRVPPPPTPPDAAILPSPTSGSPTGGPSTCATAWTGPRRSASPSMPSSTGCAGISATVTSRATGIGSGTCSIPPGVEIGRSGNCLEAT